MSCFTRPSHIVHIILCTPGTFMNLLFDAILGISCLSRRPPTVLRMLGHRFVNPIRGSCITNPRSQGSMQTESRVIIFPLPSRVLAGGALPSRRSHTNATCTCHPRQYVVTSGATSPPQTVEPQNNWHNNRTSPKHLNIGNT